MFFITVSSPHISFRSRCSSARSMVIIPELKPKRQSVFGKRTLVTYLPLPIWLFISSFFVSCCIVHNCYSVYKQGSVVCSRVVFLYRTSSNQPVLSLQWQVCTVSRSGQSPDLPCKGWRVAVFM